MGILRKSPVYHYQSATYFRAELPVTVIFHEEGEYAANWHDHDFYELVLVLSGEGYHKTLDRKVKFRRGSIFFIAPGETHCYQADHPFELVNCLFRPEFVQSFREPADYLLPPEGYEDGVQLDPESSLFRQLLDSLRRIAAEQRQNEPFSDDLIRHLFAEVLIAVHRQFAQIKRNPKFSRQAQTVRNYIASHLNEEIRIETLAEAAGLNASYLSRHFKDITGYNLTELINECKIKKACDAIRQSSESIDELWPRIGYGSKVYFYRNFKKVTGLSPVQYREQYRKKAKENV